MKLKLYDNFTWDREGIGRSQKPLSAAAAAAAAASVLCSFTPEVQKLYDKL